MLKNRPYLVAIIVTLFWGFNNVNIRYFTHNIEIPYLTFQALVLIAITLFALPRAVRKPKEFLTNVKATTKNQWLQLLLIGTLWNAYLALTYYTYAAAEHGALPAIINFLWPLIFVILVHLEKRIRIKKYEALGAALVFLGLILTIYKDTNSLNITPTILILSLIAALFGGLYTWQYTRTQNNPLTPTQNLFFFELMFLPAALLYLYLNPPTLSQPLLIGTLFAGISAGVFQPIWNRTLRHPKGTHISLLAYLIPLIAILLLALVLKEPLTLQIAVGGLLVVGGNVLIKLISGNLDKRGRRAIMEVE